MDLTVLDRSGIVKFKLQPIFESRRLKWSLGKGPFKYYVSKKVGGWGWPNAYVCLQGVWVGGFGKMLT